MIGIAINGHKLHEIQMLLAPYSNGSVSHLRYPKNRISLDVDDQKNITLLIPSMLVLELYRQGILPVDQAKEFSIHISGKKLGEYTIDDFRYPNSIDRDNIKITMKRKKQI